MLLPCSLPGTDCPSGGTALHKRTGQPALSLEFCQSQIVCARLELREPLPSAVVDWLAGLPELRQLSVAADEAASVLPLARLTPATRLELTGSSDRGPPSRQSLAELH